MAEIYDNIKPGDWQTLLSKLAQLAARLDRLEARLNTLTGAP